jgi:hypothetical protein
MKTARSNQSEAGIVAPSRPMTLCHHFALPFPHPCLTPMRPRPSDSCQPAICDLSRHPCPVNQGRCVPVKTRIVARRPPRRHRVAAARIAAPGRGHASATGSYPGRASGPATPAGPQRANAHLPQPGSGPPGGAEELAQREQATSGPNSWPSTGGWSSSNGRSSNATASCKNGTGTRGWSGRTRTSGAGGRGPGATAARATGTARRPPAGAVGQSGIGPNARAEEHPRAGDSGFLRK